MRRVETVTGVEQTNWFGDIRFRPAVIAHPMSEADIVTIVKDRAAYPTPLRAAGSNHSVSKCVVSEPGTAIDMRGMNRILEIGPDFVVVQAGALYIDVAKELEKHQLQFHVHIELGNITMGAAASTHTKKASFDGEHGTVSSYAIGMKMVLPNGDVLAVTAEQPELLTAMRSSYGLLGIIFEVTFQVRPLTAMEFHHRVFSLDEFERQLPEMLASKDSVMYYLLPFQNQVVVEYRSYRAQVKPVHRLAWVLRNVCWATVVPGCGRAIRSVPGRGLRFALFEAVASLSRIVLQLLHANDSFPADQMIRYPARQTYAKYTFSIWVFPAAGFGKTLRAYFAFCQDYYKKHHYRCDMLSVGYRILEDHSSLFSYNCHGDAMTVDPVDASGGPDWYAFVDAFNEFCSDLGAWPLFNQSPRLTGPQVQKAYGDKMETFRAIQRLHDPENRLVNAYFAEILGLSLAAPGSAAAA
jgi:FAD/FMN-containing dehydrogenase